MIRACRSSAPAGWRCSAGCSAVHLCRAYLTVAVDQAGAFGAFIDTDDLLFDITGMTGTIAVGNFTT